MVSPYVSKGRQCSAALRRIPVVWGAGVRLLKAFPLPGPQTAAGWVCRFPGRSWRKSGRFPTWSPLWWAGQQPCCSRTLQKGEAFELFMSKYKLNTFYETEVCICCCEPNLTKYLFDCMFPFFIFLLPACLILSVWCTWLLLDWISSNFLGGLCTYLLSFYCVYLTMIIVIVQICN